MNDRTARPADLFEVAIGRLDRAAGFASIDRQAWSSTSQRGPGEETRRATSFPDEEGYDRGGGGAATAYRLDP